MSVKTIQTIIDYLAHQGINTRPAAPRTYAINKPGNQTDPVSWSRAGYRPTTKPVDGEYMGLASMAAVEQLDLAHDQLKVLDICAAPGMKSLYTLLSYPTIKMYVNDLSEQRLIRLKTLYKKYGITAERITKQDGATLSRTYPAESFNRIILDAPCSGEGVILGDDPAMLSTWSPAKVKRLQQLQIKLLKDAWKLLAPNGRLVYATCTLNKNENERVIKKALGIQLDARVTTLSPSKLTILRPNNACRILPSEHSIGFFYAVLVKPPNDD